MAKTNQDFDYLKYLKQYELPADKLSWKCPLDLLNFETTEDIKPLDKIIGQERAVEAIRLGAELRSKGYNIFVSGLSGTGRMTTVKSILESVTTPQMETYDYCYVNNFQTPENPKLIKLEKGKARHFKKAMEDAITYLKSRLPKLFEEDGLKNAKQKIIEEYQEKERVILNEFDNTLKENDFIRGQIENEQGIVTPEVFPIIDNKAVAVESLFELISEKVIDEEKAKEIQKKYDKFHSMIYEVSRKSIKLMQELRQALIANDKAAAKNIVKDTLEVIAENYKNDKIRAYIDDVNISILDNLQIFIPSTQTVSEVADASDETPIDPFYIYSVNVVLDNSETNNAPVIMEITPSYTNLFGTIDRSYDARGFWRTDFTKIRAGSILKADKGFLIVNAIDLFSEPGVWNALKRVLLYNQVEIQALDSPYLTSLLHLKPEPIEIDVKVIIIGGLSLYKTLFEYEKGFKKIFKINAQFDYEIERTNELLHDYSSFIAKICKEENIAHCTKDGVAALLEWAVQHTGSQDNISLKFSDIADLLREAAFYDRNSSSTHIGREDVLEAIRQRDFRNNMIDEKLKKQILKGDTLIDTDGERVGQINGLTVLDTGTYDFGQPSRITAVISAGNSGIINIEREVDMSGAIHNKGVLILSGILRSLFAKHKPMNLTASLSFEQNYGGIDGDSATAAEIYAILSALSEVPIKQNLAITGSINQLGDVQPIGGVNEKIRGFYEICKQRGLTGDQGVLIPVQNVKDLMLRDDLIADVHAGKFHIYSYSRIEEGVSIMMGLPSGYTADSEEYDDGSIFALAQSRIEKLRDSEKDEPKASKKGKAKKKSNKKKMQDQ